MKQIFPKEIIDSTVEVHQFKHAKKSQIIYTIILSALVVIIVLLPFKTVDIYTSARGIIKPDKDRLLVSSLNSGKILETNLKHNKSVTKGDTLLVLDNAIIIEKLKLSEQQIADAKLFVEDLTYLTQNSSVSISKIKSPKYQKEYILYKQKLAELQTRLKKLTQDYERNTKLFNKGVIAKVEYENTKLDYDLALNSLHQLRQQHHSSWQATLTEYKNSLLKFESTNNQLEENKSQYVVTAPISGELLNTTSLEVGSYLTAGQTFVEISPNTNLRVECYISSQDIGLLRQDNMINFQIDAYNYNQWGLATGTITDIGKDIELINNTSVFKVLCKLNQCNLKLKNGFEGKLKKGMTLSAQFKLTERSLFDLLYDKVDDWLNPGQNKLAMTDG